MYSIIVKIVPQMVQLFLYMGDVCRSQEVSEMANEELKAILAKLKARDGRDIAKEIASESKYSSKINKYISSLEELRF